MYVVAYKDLETDSVKSVSSDEIVQIMLNKKKKTLSDFEPTHEKDFSTRKEYGRVKIEKNGSKYVYRILIIAMAETKDDLENMRREGRLKVLATPKNKQGPYKDLYANYMKEKERDTATKEKADQVIAKKLGKKLAQDQLAKKLLQSTNQAHETSQKNNSIDVAHQSKASPLATLEQSANKAQKPNETTAFGAEISMVVQKSRENNSIIDADHQSKASQLPTIMERRVRKASETNDKSDDSGDEMSIVTKTSQQHQNDNSRDPFMFSFKDDPNKKKLPFSGFNNDPPLSTIIRSSSKSIGNTNHFEIEDKECVSCCPCVTEIKESLARIEDLLSNKRSYSSAMTALEPEESAKEVVEGFVDLGKGCLVKLSKIEKVVKTDESLQTKISSILSEMFKQEELKKYFLKRSKKMDPDAQPFPSDCITKILKAINEANKAVTKKKIIQCNAKRLNTTSPEDLKAAMEYIDMMTAAQAQDVDEKKFRRALSHILSNSRNELMGKENRPGGKGSEDNQVKENVNDGSSKAQTPSPSRAITSFNDSEPE